jgi:hypothetical protein
MKPIHFKANTYSAEIMSIPSKLTTVIMFLICTKTMSGLNSGANTYSPKWWFSLYVTTAPFYTILNSLFTTYAVIQHHPVRATTNKHYTINVSQGSTKCYINTTIIIGLYPKHALTMPGSGSQLLAMEGSVQSSKGSCGIYGEHSCTGIYFSSDISVFSYQYHCTNHTCLEKLAQWQNSTKPSHSDSQINNQWLIRLSVLFIYPHHARLILGHDTINGDHGKGQRWLCLT